MGYETDDGKGQELVAEVAEPYDTLSISGWGRGVVEVPLIIL